MCGLIPNSLRALELLIHVCFADASDPITRDAFFNLCGMVLELVCKTVTVPQLYQMTENYYQETQVTLSTTFIYLIKDKEECKLTNHILTSVRV